MHPHDSAFFTQIQKHTRLITPLTVRSDFILGNSLSSILTEDIYF